MYDYSIVLISRRTAGTISAPAVLHLKLLLYLFIPLNGFGLLDYCLLEEA